MQTSILRKIEQKTIGEEVVNILRDAIINGKLELGAHLGEIELANQMSVSRIPIREALRELEQEGLVVRLPNRGCFVINFTEQDVREVFSLRLMLESMSFEWAIPRLSEADFCELERLIEAQSGAIQRQDYEELASLDMHFHEFLCNRAGHSRLLKSWYEQHAQCQILLNLRFRTMAEFTPGTVVCDHSLILAALRAGDAAQAAQISKEISDRVVPECIETLLRISPHTKP